jgi:LEA14-like dessication related protein
MNKLKPIALIAGLGLIGFAIYRYYQRQLKFLEDITYKVIGLQIKKFTLQSVSLDITTQIFNASNIEATVKEMYLDAYINGVKVGNVNEVKDILILPQKSSIVTFNFTFDPRIIGKNIVDIITGSLASKDLVFDVKGYMKVKSGFLTLPLPFEYRNNLKSVLKK